MPETETKKKKNTVDDDDLRCEIISRFDTCKEYFSEWNDEAEEDYEFALGDQWTEEERNKLKEQNRPCLTFNRIKPIINIVSGYQRENSARIKVSPEGGEDRVFSEIMDKCIGFIDRKAKLEYKLGYLFDDGLYCGKGFIEAVRTFDKDIVRGELKFILNGPFQILPDPNCMEYDLNEGAEYVFKVCKYTKSKLKSMFPKKANIIDDFSEDTDDIEINSGAGVLTEGDADDYGAKPNRATKVKRTRASIASGEEELDSDITFTYKEYWRAKEKTIFFLIDSSGLPVQFDSKELAEKYIVDNNLSERKIYERQKKQMWVAIMVCGHILEDDISPHEPHYSGYPFFRYMADWVPSCKNELLKVQGMTRSLKDPQRDKNKSRSQFLHILNTSANSGWKGDRNALSPEGWRQLKKMGSSPGIVVKQKPGTNLQEILPKSPPLGFLERERSADAEFKEISSINPDLMGIQEGTSSGKAISLRIKQAVLSLARMFSNYSYTKELLGLFILQMIPEVFDVERVKRVVGANYINSLKESGDQRFAEGLQDSHIEAFLQLVKDSRYDLEVSESSKTKTMRYEIFQQLLDLANTPQGQLLPLEFIIDYSDIQNADEIKEQIKNGREAQANANRQVPGK